MDLLTSSISSVSNIRSTDVTRTSKPSKSHKKLIKLVSRPLNFFRRGITKKDNNEEAEDSTVRPFEESSGETAHRESAQNLEARGLSSEAGKTTTVKDILPSGKLDEGIIDQTQTDSEHDLLASQSSSRPSTNYSIIHNSIITQSQKGYQSASNVDLLKNPIFFIHGLTHLSILNFEMISSSSRSGEAVISSSDEKVSKGRKELQHLSSKESKVFCDDEEPQQPSSSRRNSESNPKNSSEDFAPSIIEHSKQYGPNETDDKGKSKEYKFVRSDDSVPYREPVYEDKSTWISSNVLQALWNLLEGDEPHK